MTLLKPYQILIRNLREEISESSNMYMSRGQALKKLRELTGKDFGYDSDAWQEWISKNKDVFREAGKTLFDFVDESSQ